MCRGIRFRLALVRNALDVLTFAVTLNGIVVHEHVFVKEPATEDKTPWHHDQPYYCVDGFDTCSLFFFFIFDQNLVSPWTNTDCFTTK